MSNIVSFEAASGLKQQKQARKTRAYSSGVQATRQDAWRKYFGALPNPDLILKKLGKRIVDYEELMTDAQVHSAWQNRTAGVKALEWIINAEEADSEQSKFIEAVFEQLKVEQLIDAILEAVLYGIQFLEIYWQPRQNRIIPVAIEEKPREWFTFTTQNQPRLIQPNGSNAAQGEALIPRKWLVVQHKPKYKNPYGEAILSRCWWPVQFKKNGWKFWVRFADKFGSPYMTGKTGPGASDEEIDALYSDLEQLRQDGVLVTAEDVEVDILEASKNSGTFYRELIQECRIEITQAILSHTSATQATEGKLGQDHTAMQVRDDIVKGDRQLVETTFNQLIRWIVDINFPAGTSYPTFRLIEKQALDKGRAERDELLTKNGQVRLTKPYYERNYGFAPDEIEIIEPQAMGGVALSSPPIAAVSPAAAPALPTSAAQAAQNDTGTFEEAQTITADVVAVQTAVKNFMNSDSAFAAMQNLQQQLVRAIGKGSSYQEIDAMLAPLVGALSTTEVETLVANAVFAADTIARLQTKKETDAALEQDFSEPPSKATTSPTEPIFPKKSLWQQAGTFSALFKETSEKRKQYPAPANAVQWEALRTFDEAALRRRGLASWSDDADDPARGLMLFPGPWYSSIPEGYEVVDIFGKKELFKRDKLDNDTRFGFLAFGIMPFRAQKP